MQFRALTGQEEAEGRLAQPVFQLPGWEQLNFKSSMGFTQGQLWMCGWVRGWGTQGS